MPVVVVIFHSDSGAKSVRGVALEVGGGGERGLDRGGGVRAVADGECAAGGGVDGTPGAYG